MAPYIPAWLRILKTDISSAPPELYYQVTKADADLPHGPCRGLVAGTAGTVNVMRLDGVIVTGFPLQQGWNPLPCLQVRTGGSADNIWAFQ